jgi:hypothetical protein
VLLLHALELVRHVAPLGCGAHLEA